MGGRKKHIPAGEGERLQLRGRSRLRGVTHPRETGAAPHSKKKPAANAISRHAPVGHLLRRAYFRARENSLNLFGENGLTTRQASALMQIGRAQPLSQAELGDAIGMEPANVHGIVARLKQKKLVETARDTTDPRRVNLRLSKSGESMATGLARVARESEKLTLSLLSDAEARQLVALLRKLLGTRGK